MKPGQVIYTSIPAELERHAGNRAYGGEYQRECVRSWRDAGLKVVSVNPESELRQLRTLGMDVEFVSNGTADERTRIGTILSLIRGAGDSVAGIINADCYLIDLGFANDAVLSAARGSLVALERISIDPASMRPTGLYCGGFDGFFFDTQFIADLPDEDAWTIGSPQWDYWFPLAMHLAGARLKKPDALILLHLNHPVKWDRAEYFVNASRLWRHLSGMRLDPLPPGLVQQVRAYNSDAREHEPAIERFLDSVASWLIDSREPFHLCDPGGKGDFLRRILAAMESRMTFG